MQEQEMENKYAPEVEESVSPSRPATLVPLTAEASFQQYCVGLTVKPW